METQNSGEETKQQKSFAEEQARYWKSFVHDLFLGTLKRMIVSPLVFGITFLVIAYLIYRAISISFAFSGRNVFQILSQNHSSHSPLYSAP